MGVYSEVEGIPEPYDPQFKLWDEARTYRQGDEVPDVGMADTYSVRLEGGTGKATRYLTVQGGCITNLLAHQPVHMKSVFDKWGRFLGVGGARLEDPGPSPLEQALNPIEEALRRARKPSSWPEPRVLETPRGQVPELQVQEHLQRQMPERAFDDELRVHRFWIRNEIEAELRLPADLTEAEAERLAAFVRMLPMGR